MTDSRDKALESLIAKDEIRDLVMAYCRAIDRKDFDMLETLYHPGAGDDLRPVARHLHDYLDRQVAATEGDGVIGGSRVDCRVGEQGEGVHVGEYLSPGGENAPLSRDR